MLSPARDAGSLDLDRLRRQWLNLSGKTAAPGLTRALLQRLIAYEQQVARLGGLAHETERMLTGIAADSTASMSDGSASARLARVTGSDRRFAPGTILVREWHGTLQRVTVMQDGFAWNGVTYPSLSRVAREITGINWNGHVFFGGAAKASSADRQHPARTGRRRKQCVSVAADALP